MIIIGGTDVISPSVENQLTSLGIKTTRLSGQDRYETSISIAEKLIKPDNLGEIAIVTGEDFADALSISPIAAKKKMPIILVQHDVIPDVVKNFINTHHITKTYVIGIGSSLDESLISKLPNVEQINGNDKYQRNLAVIDKFKSEIDFDSIYLTSGEDFADGLSGTVLAGKNCNPLLLVGEDSVRQKGYLDKNSITNYNVVVLGGKVTEKAILASDDNVDYEEKTINDVTNFKSEDIIKIIFSDGSGMNKPLTVENQQKVKEFLGYIDDYVVKKVPDPYMIGWARHAKFYNKAGDKVMEINFNDPLTINKDYYEIIKKPDLDYKKIDQFLHSIDSSWNIHD